MLEEFRMLALASKELKGGQRQFLKDLESRIRHKRTKWDLLSLLLQEYTLRYHVSIEHLPKYLTPH